MQVSAPPVGELSSMDATSKVSRSPRAILTEGSTMRHVLMMTATGSAGRIALFIVDLFADLCVLVARRTPDGSGGLC
jgi:hypothetical protein